MGHLIIMRPNLTSKGKTRDRSKFNTQLGTIPQVPNLDLFLVFPFGGLGEESTARDGSAVTNQANPNL